MTDIKVCRICVRTDVKMYHINQFELKYYYEEVMALKINEKDGLPWHFCYECAAMLHKFHKFKEKCSNGQKVLKELMWKVGPLTIKSIHNIDRQIEQLQSSLSLITVNHRVKTYQIKSKEEPRLQKTDEQVNNYSEMVSLTDDDDYVDDYDRDEPLLPEVVHDDEKIDDVVQMDDDKLTVEQINGDEEKIPPNEIVTDIVKVFTDDEKIGEKLLTNDEKIPIDSIEKIHDVENMEIDKLKVEQQIKDGPVTVSATDSDDYIDEYDDNDELSTLSEEVDFDEKIDDVEKVVKDNGDEEKIPPTKNIKFIKIDDERMIDDNEELFASDKNIPINDIEIEKTEEVVVENKKEPTKSRLTDKKAKQFDVKKTELNPNNWLKFNLSEEEALKDFKSRALDDRFQSAKFKCNDCLIAFSEEDMLNRHVILRHSESVGALECHFCHMRFKWKSWFDRHMRKHYIRYKCLRCGLVIRLGQAMNYHEEYHNGVLNKCGHCGEEFKHKTTYYSHLRTHGGEHACTLCGASFVSAAGLSEHKVVKHIETESCGKRIATQMACREQHKAEHPRAPLFLPDEKKICEICGKFLARNSILGHLNTHTREKLYSCNTCGRQFNNKSVLKMHQLTHSSVKLSACKLCDKRFKQASGLLMHHRTFHLQLPYPKRNRKKKTEKISKLEDYSEDSDDNMTLDKLR